MLFRRDRDRHQEYEVTGVECVEVCEGVDLEVHEGVVCEEVVDLEGVEEHLVVHLEDEVVEGLTAQPHQHTMATDISSLLHTTSTVDMLTLMLPELTEQQLQDTRHTTHTLDTLLHLLGLATLHTVQLPLSGSL